VRHAWTSTTCSRPTRWQGIETRPRDLQPRTLAPLAQVNVESLKEFAFFTFAKADGKKEKFQEPVDYFLEYKDSALTLHFTLPLKTPVKTKQLALESVSTRRTSSISSLTRRIRSSCWMRPPPAR